MITSGPFFVVVLFVGAAFAFDGDNATVHEHEIEKRQIFVGNTNGFPFNTINGFFNGFFQFAPAFDQRSYSFTLQDCSAGAFIAILTANNPVGIGNIAYDVDANLPLTSTNIAVNYLTGQLNLATSVSSNFTVNVRASNGYGADVVPVSISCSANIATAAGINTICFNGFCYSNRTGSTSSTGTNINQYVCFDGYCYRGGSTSGATSTGSFSTGYSFATSSCLSGATVGNVSSTGALAYLISSGSGGFTISSTGAITLSTAQSAGAYSIVIAAVNSTGTTSTTTVSITVSCTATNSSSSGGSGNTISNIASIYLNSSCLYANCLFNYTAPIFSQQTYTFGQTNCTAGQTIGTVAATNAAGYFIETGTNFWSNFFVVNATTGVITSVNSVPQDSQAYITVTAYNGNGVPTNVLVYVNFTGCSVVTTTTVATTATGTPCTTTCTPVFPQTSYTFALSSCTANTVIGSVTATNTSFYTITGPADVLSINPNTGVISTTGIPLAGTYNTVVTATNSTTGASQSVPVSITVTCSGAATTALGFPATLYSFATTQCTAGTVVGTVAATNAIAYAIDGGSPFFAVSTAGVITLLNTIPAGTYTVPVRAFSNGASLATTVTIMVSGAGCAG